ncbi:metallophosphoesterase family protein [Nocardia vinacea]|uniref:Metallophosphoesterase family protein n=1 Tax=Nocardia vinacea TaxID=96468 RepID=A0ABZ1YHZ6_9NOCA|nr:metallophosphoesterase [Nocardia vinacea]
MIWYTSDLHIGHIKVANERGFDTTDEHDAELAARWDDLVRPGDQVWVQGDISIGGRANEIKALQWCGERPGELHFLPGNHDGCHGMRSKSARWQRIYLGVFHSVQQVATHKIAGQRVSLSHFPLRGDPDGDHTPEHRFEAYRHSDGGQYHLHGHTHSKVQQRGRQLHIGPDAHDLSPVSQQWVADRIMAGDETPSIYPDHEKQLNTFELQLLREATLYRYEAGGLPPDLPESVRRYANQPDGGLIDIIDLVIRQARKFDAI